MIKKIDLTITDTVRDGAVAYWGYTDTITEDEEEVPNPQTKDEFMYEKIQEYIANSYEAEASKAGEVARVEAVETAKTDTANLTVAVSK